MPSSYVDAVAPIVHALVALAPRRVVDVGPGWGKYGLLVREYLGVVADAIEVEPGRLPTQDALYGTVHVGDVRRFTPAFWREQGWDLALLVDVIEHMPKADGHALLARLHDAGTAVLISTPKVFFSQHDPRNPYEEHVSHWTWQDLVGRYAIMRDASTPDSLIYVVGPGR